MLSPDFAMGYGALKIQELMRHANLKVTMDTADQYPAQSGLD